MSHPLICKLHFGSVARSSLRSKTAKPQPGHRRKLLGEVTASGVEDVEAAVAGARAALPAWRSLPAPKRGGS